MEQDLDPLDAIKGTRECCYTLRVLKLEQQVDYLHKQPNQAYRQHAATVCNNYVVVPMGS